MTTADAPRGPGPLIWAGLIAAALLQLSFNVWIGLDADDTENLETTRILAAARQFIDGPGTLYGPYSGANPCVLIQAPFYYRLTAVGGWPLVRLGVDPVTACLAAGRAISFLSFLGLLALTYRFARFGGATRQAGALAAVLLAGTPMIGSFPVTMRPDMLGVLLQTAGLFGVVSALASPRPRGSILIAAYLAFALALVTKQHYVVGPLLASGLLAWGWWTGRVRMLPILAAHAAAIALVVGYLAAEEILTGGAMSRAVFLLPGDLQRVTAGSWSYTAVVYGEALKRSIGLLILAVAVAWAVRGRLGAFEVGGLLFLGLELVLMTKLCLNSSGAWFNYALQATVVLAVLLGRGLASPAVGRRGLVRWLPLVVAALLIAAADVRLVAKGVRDRVAARRQYRELLADARVAEVPTDARYFPGHLQHYNVRAGCGPLTHDEWLYEAFEAIDEAEPRERWLREALTDGPIRLVIAEPTEGRDARVAGIDEPLTALGFKPAGTVGRLSLWQRR